MCRALSYSKASAACKKIGAYLVSYNTAAEQARLAETCLWLVSYW